MAGSTVSRSAKFYCFRPGKGADTPVLVPIFGRATGVRLMTQFCRRISPRTPILVLNAAALVAADSQDRVAGSGQGVDGLAAHIATAVRALDLSLIPLIPVGHGDGADLACKLILAHGRLFAAGVLLRPAAAIAVKGQRSLEGIPLLLASQAGDDVVGSAGWRLAEELNKAGADVISERVLPRRTPSSRDAALARIFVATLFGS